ncbi:tRNA (adenosine(37)-N6)-threonylcarbamoyltransferase complex dimerization subunit type 1 TsaB [Anaerococcus sp. AGMB00486]|uniref:tRNA (Adenosine(37)-N6)-threonylcarbamoyltransferase complex dimerization subunit type 1 TsaB n=2 Tax=Anaerococcus TaxID=165779 RepID=A0ABX2NCP1_9FIRM|nr:MULTISPECIES: tRNA (adenosine(37)-N6)-threonylcarbamoyltransferase complex dimerization subunit type 1 TsaB [Anaerococcus]MDY3005531.1 tRNA (adenosine(37)-N6)-threonylcarbamoyltransferase complex dimerization subunit type 1 TsaB [Anaerococcus porci]MSS78623.1 tRNA (adenosine(37)-N6)-threonylcarbamoyltransferase complex dimerization subunit type 1 TsaB [Anaerococcus porci]NVF12491.1 tRNA (adenosine(37)-N6)-threonylcarbamoyltransferase complex dimerization subunit type 1 TsaB [Anaerococcus faec
MRVLAIDTSTMISTVSISEDGKIIGDFNVNQEKTHSESLVPMIESLLSFLGLRLSDIDIFAVAKGPGSFTGLRIGMTIAKTFAQVRNKKLIPISTLKALALNSSSKYKASMLDARGNRVYGALYGENLEEIVKEDLYNIDDFSNFCNDSGLSFDLVSEISIKYKDKFKRANILDFSYTSCIGRNLCKLAIDMKDEEFELFKLVPNYMRKSQAEIDRKKKLND